LGKRLLNHALQFCDQKSFKETHLWTVKGLDTARAMYEKNGFNLVEEYVGNQWGSEIIEQKLVRYHPDI
jgi:GNAT superfamily N-acetyltransferase